MSLTIRVTTRFQRDTKKMARRHKELTKLEAVITRWYPANHFLRVIAIMP
ncbi:MAG: hypothetical protein OWU33_02435 [Firmicutes bacterium]|nr:hypothetical protein [Bacillota bacterium]